MRTELGRPQVEVQQCALNSEWRRAWPRAGKATVDVEVELGEEEEADEEKEEEEEEEEDEENSSDKIQPPSPGRWGTKQGRLVE